MYGIKILNNGKLFGYLPLYSCVMSESRYKSLIQFIALLGCNPTQKKRKADEPYITVAKS